MQDLHQRKAVLHADGHEEARHQWEVEGHLTFLAGVEISHRVLGPLVGLGQQNAVLVFRVDVRPELPQKGVRLGQILAIGPFAFVQIRHRVQPESVDAEIEPEVDHFQNRLAHLRIVEIQIRLMRVETVPIVGFCDRIPGPVGCLEILEDDARVQVFIRRVAPHVEVAPARSRGGPARALEPGMLIRRVV